MESINPGGISIDSKLFSNSLNNESGLIEFMDIHSEGYNFLKNNPENHQMH